MEKTIYVVRALSVEGELIRKEEYRSEDRAVRFVRNQVEKDRVVRIKRLVKEGKFRIEPNGVWGIATHDSWISGPQALSTIFIHTSVTKQLEPNATVEEEREQMRSVDNIAHARGFNGISYSFGVLPSGNAYQGRGFGVVEAATEGYNTSADSICMIGNTDTFNPTEAQLESAIAIIQRGQANGWYAQTLDIRGHREVAAKACPGAKFTDEMIQHIQRTVNHG